MSGYALHVGGPFYIHAYGFWIMVALTVFWLCLYYNQQRKTIVSNYHLERMLSIGIIAALIGGRILFIITEWHLFESWFDYIAFWRGGLCILGTIIGVVIAETVYCVINNINVIGLGDMCARYAPLLQGIARLGCFFSGCCYGIASNLPWACYFEDNAGFVQLAHPTQLYSFGAHFLLFLLLYFFAQKPHKQGTITVAYLIGAATERCLIDFFRAERTIAFGIFSVQQCIAFGIISITAVLFWYYSHKQRHYEPI